MASVQLDAPSRPAAPYVGSFLAQRTNAPVVWSATPTAVSSFTNAALAGGHVKALVYVDAFMPDEGETTFAVLGDSGSALAVPDPATVLDIVGYPGAARGGRRRLP